MRPGRSAAVGFIFITLLLDVIGFGIIIPVIPKLIMGLSGKDLSHASQIGGWLMFAYAIMQFTFAPILGGLSDQYGRRPILLGSLFGFGIDYLFSAFAPTIGWLFVGRMIAGIMGSSFTTASAYIADVSPPEKRSQNFGLIGAAFGLGFIIGPAIGGFLGAYGPRAPFIAAACLAFLNWLYGLFILPESLKPENRRAFDWKRANPVGTLSQLRKYPIISGLLVSLVLLYIAAWAVQGGWSYYTMEKFQWDERMVGISLSVVGLITAIVQAGLIRIIIPKLGQQRGVYVGLSLYCFGFLCFAFATKGWMMFAALVPYCLGGIAGPSLQGIISTQVAPNVQGELQGGLTSMMSATAIVAPPLMTGIFSYFTGQGAPVYFPGAAMLTGAVLTFLSALLAYRTLSNKS
ncbi:MAG: TCR/Tet family MFS transporter [Saprospiraceae bacterium]|nr:TCR/Tet family MFS transporter [Saprospiraceae bacterium]MCB9342328.1 TCR/Tet family MFS transporter [Lewinellaceae bacterium]